MTEVLRIGDRRRRQDRALGARAAVPGDRRRGDRRRSRTRPSSSARARPAALGIPRAVRHWGELVEDPDIDAILVGTWPYLHAPIAIAALEAGKHVLTEARMATDADCGRARCSRRRWITRGWWRWSCRRRSRSGPTARSVACWATARSAGCRRCGWLGRAAAGATPASTGAGSDASAATTSMALGIVGEAMARWLGPRRMGQRGDRDRRTAQAGRRRPPGADRRRRPRGRHRRLPGRRARPTHRDVHREPARRRHRAVFVGTEGTLEADFGAQTLTVSRPGAPDAAVEIAPDERDEWRCRARLRGRDPGRGDGGADRLRDRSALHGIRGRGPRSDRTSGRRLGRGGSGAAIGT